MTLPAAKSTAVKRSPIVVVMGHIDHGKTTILDWYRKTKVVDKEAGGITQHIGAYEVEHEQGKITFIDTPGHEAFSKIRSRGATVADIGILVVAADEGIKPQTTEAIEIIRQTGIPFVVALNKIDKPDANPDRVKQELAKADVLVESYGGKIPSVEISAKQGTHMDELLETLLLVADLEDLTCDPTRAAEGVVIETNRDPRRGITATLLIKDGTLHTGDILVVGRNVETAKILENFLGAAITEVLPSAPALIAGFSHMPAVGEMFRAFGSKQDAETFLASLSAIMPSPAPMISPSEEEGKMVFNIVLKTDVAGSREALEESLKKFESDTIAVRIIRSEVGDINENDVKLAIATRLVTIVGFKVRLDAAVRELARRHNIRIVAGDVIYRLLDEVKDAMRDILPPVLSRVLVGTIKILKVFKKEGKQQIIGGRVEEGAITKASSMEVKRNQQKIGTGTIAGLQRERKNVEEVPAGAECGISASADIEIREGDLLECYREEKTPVML